MLLYLLSICVFMSTKISTDALCTFPNDLRGNWLSSRKGNVTFSSTRLSGYHPCRYPAFCPPSLPDSWECWDRVEERHVIRTDKFKDSGSSGRVYMCLYFYRVSSKKYLVYQSPTVEKGAPFHDYVRPVSERSPDLFVSDLCDLQTRPPLASRYNLLVKSDSIHSTRSTCPPDLLGVFQVSGQCQSTMDVCSDMKDVRLHNSNCTLPLFYSESGQLSCLYSLASGSTTYVTLYNHDLVVDGNTTALFVCLAVTQTNNQIFINQNPSECTEMTTPTAANQSDLELEVNHLCQYSCNFSSSLTGSWISSRKGPVVISGDLMTGFEPRGENCTSCSHLPTDFRCYMRSGSMYLLRSQRTEIYGQSVRVYVCLDIAPESSFSKIIYYQAHETKHPDLNDHVAVLNAGVSVESMEVICSHDQEYEPALYSVLIRSGYVDSSVTRCPLDLHGVYRTTDSECTFTLSTCDNQMTLTSSADQPSTCKPADVVTRCVYAMSGNGTTFVTLIHTDDRQDIDTVYFSCVAYQKTGSVLKLTFASTGCHAGQNYENVSNGFAISLQYISGCPTSDNLYWIAIAIVFCLVLLVIVMLLARIIYKKNVRRHESDKTDDDELMRGNSDARADRLDVCSTVGDGENKQWMVGVETDRLGVCSTVGDSEHIQWMVGVEPDRLEVCSTVGDGEHIQWVVGVEAGDVRETFVEITETISSSSVEETRFQHQPGEETRLQQLQGDETNVQQHHGEETSIQEHQRGETSVQEQQGGETSVHEQQGGETRLQEQGEKTRLQQQQGVETRVQEQGGEKTKVQQQGEETKVQQQGDETRGQQQGDETSVQQQRDETRVQQQRDDTRGQQQGDETRVQEQEGEETKVQQQGDETRGQQQGDETRVQQQRDETRVQQQRDDTRGQQQGDETRIQKQQGWDNRLQEQRDVATIRPQRGEDTRVRQQRGEVAEQNIGDEFLQIRDGDRRGDRDPTKEKTTTQTGDTVSPQICMSEDNSHILRAWTTRQAHLLRFLDTGSPLSRREHERNCRKKSSDLRCLKLSSLVERDTWQRKQINPQHSTQINRKFSAQQNCPPVVTSQGDGGMLKLLSGHLMEVPFYDEYRTFTKTRDQMERDTFWNSGGGNVKTSDEYFGFTELEKQLQGHNYMSDNAHRFPVGVRKLDELEPVPTIFLPKITTTLVPTEEDYPGLTICTPPLISMFPGRSSGGVKDKLEYEASIHTSDDPMSRFRARLEELEAIKGSHTEDTTHQAEGTTQSRKRVRTAVRRLLTERLFAVDLGVRSNKIQAKVDLGDHIHRHDARDECHHPPWRHSLSLDQQRHGKDDRKIKVAYNVNNNNTIQRNRWRLPCVEILPRVSMYPPVVGSHRTRYSQCRSYREKSGGAGGVQNLPKFAVHTAPKKCLGGFHTVEHKTDPGHRQGGDFTLSYTMPTNDVYLSQKTTPYCSSDDPNLRKLLEELYRDKKYMDKLINTSAADSTERQVRGQLQTGRDYLLQRAQFWLQKGPLPPRPPTTDLGLRMQRIQAVRRLKPRQMIQPLDQVQH